LLLQLDEALSTMSPDWTRMQQLAYQLTVAFSEVKKAKLDEVQCDDEAALARAVLSLATSMLLDPGAAAAQLAQLDAGAGAAAADEPSLPFVLLMTQLSAMRYELGFDGLSGVRFCALTGVLSLGLMETKASKRKGAYTPQGASHPLIRGVQRRLCVRACAR
jgi:hypothetical protein